MFSGPVGRLVAVLRRGDVLPGPAPMPAAGRGPRRAAPAGGFELRDVTEAVPGLLEELGERARSAGLLVGWVAVLVMPVWTFVDRIAAPEQAGAFLLVRMLCEIPMLLAL